MAQMCQPRGMGRIKAQKPKKEKAPTATSSSTQGMAGLPSGIDPRIINMTPEEVEAFIERVRGLLPAADAAIAIGMAATIGAVAIELKAKRISIARLSALMFGAPTEKTSKVIGASAKPSKLPKEKAAGHGKTPALAIPGAEQIQVPHESVKTGDECTECPNGRMYPMAEPAVMVRFTGLSPLRAVVAELERLRCNACGHIVRAKTPVGFTAERYDESVPATVALMKYGAGLPFYRMARLTRNLGLPLAASTQWDLIRKVAPRLDPVMEEMERLAAQAEVIHNDDTTMKLLDRPDLKLNPKERKGIYTSGLLARIRVEGHPRAVALFRTGNRHAGENLADLLKQRGDDLGPPIQMCDALAANTKGDFQTILGHCLAHARRRFVEVVEDFPTECQHLLEVLGEVYRVDRECQDLLAAERLARHQVMSGPRMEELHLWLSAQIRERKVEPNSGLGRAIEYMLKHWEPLTLFLREPDAPLDNNLCERALKRAVLHRKNSLFYRTRAGAEVGDAFMSVIHTCELNDVNPFNYLVAVLKHPVQAEDSPEDWMPWNYRAALAELEG